MKFSYLNLCTEFYDLTKPEAGLLEISFYEEFLQKSTGLVLEAMCGSGRLLIPLLKRGLVIEGVDNSSAMLRKCQQRCRDQNLPVTLYNQSLQEVSLSKQYEIIFIAIGSFQLIVSQADALQVLKNLRAALLPQGKLITYLTQKWQM